MSARTDYVRVHIWVAETWPPPVCTRTYPAYAANETPGNRGFAFSGSSKIALPPEGAALQVCSAGDFHDMREERSMPDPPK
jgi:hypothetical protein